MGSITLLKQFVMEMIYIALLAPPSALCLMLDTCNQFARSYSLVFNAAKTQLIKLSCCRSSSDDGTVEFRFLGQKLYLISHLRNILCSQTLSDSIIMTLLQ